jgi:hypothetical protein
MVRDILQRYVTPTKSEMTLVGSGGGRHLPLKLLSEIPVTLDSSETNSAYDINQLHIRRFTESQPINCTNNTKYYHFTMPLLHVSASTRPLLGRPALWHSASLMKRSASQCLLGSASIWGLHVQQRQIGEFKVCLPTSLQNTL